MKSLYKIELNISYNFYVIAESFAEAEKKASDTLNKLDYKLTCIERIFKLAYEKDDNFTIENKLVL